MPQHRLGHWAFALMFHMGVLAPSAWVVHHLNQREEVTAYQHRVELKSPTPLLKTIQLPTETVMEPVTLPTERTFENPEPIDLNDQNVERELKKVIQELNHREDIKRRTDPISKTNPMPVSPLADEIVELIGQPSPEMRKARPPAPQVAPATAEAPTETKPVPIAASEGETGPDTWVAPKVSPRPLSNSLKRRMPKSFTFEAVVDAEGVVTKIEIVPSTGNPNLDSELIEVLKTWTYQAATRNGVATQAVLRQTIRKTN